MKTSTKTYLLGTLGDLVGLAINTATVLVLMATAAAGALTLWHLAPKLFAL